MSDTTMIPPQDMSTDDIESELLTLAGHIAAAECRSLQLPAEFDDRNGWAGDGIRSCAHWLSWRARMDLRTATEHLRVARALQHELFARLATCWTKDATTTPAASTTPTPWCAPRARVSCTASTR